MTESEELRHLAQLEDKGEFIKFLHEAERLEKRYSELGRHQQLADVLILKIKALWKLGRTEESLKGINQCEHELTFIDQPREVKKREAHLARHKGIIYALRHDFKRSMEYFQKSLALAEEINDKEAKFSALINIVDIDSSMGDLQPALNSMQQIKPLAGEIEDPYYSMVSLISLGELYFRKGDLDKAKHILQRALTLTMKHDTQYFMASVITSLGQVYWELGNLEQALDYFDQSNTLYKRIGAQYGPASVVNLFYLVSLTIEIGSLEQAQKYLQLLQQINEQEENIFIRPFYHIAKSMLLKTSSRIRDKVKAQDILLKLVEGEFKDVQIKIIIMLTLCELLLDEVKSYEDETVFKEALEIAQQVYLLAQKSRSFSLEIKLLLLQAKFATVEGNFEASMNLINQAKIAAKEKGLDLLAMRADAEKQQLEAQFEKWQQLIKSNALFGARIEQSHLEEYLREVRRIIKLSKL